MSKISAKVVERSQGLLEPGEQVRRVLLAQGGINPWAQVVFFMVGLIGTLSGTWAQTELAGERLWVHKKWHGDAAAFAGRLG